MNYNVKVVEYLFKIARDDRKYNFHFAPFVFLSQKDGKAKLFNSYHYHPDIEDAYYKIYINGFEINLEDKRKRSLSLSLKPGKYNIKVKAYIKHALGKAYARDEKFDLNSKYDLRYVMSSPYWCEREIERETIITVTESNEVFLWFYGHMHGKFEYQKKRDFYEPNILKIIYSLYEIVESYRLEEVSEEKLDSLDESWVVYAKFRYDEVPIDITNKFLINNVKKDVAKVNNTTPTNVSTTSKDIISSKEPSKPIVPPKSKEVEIKNSDGSKYIGQVNANNKYHGKGKLYFANGSVYEGDFTNGDMIGKCVFTYENGDKYIGEFKYGYRYGLGTYYFKNGDRYEGEFVDNKFNGKGIYYYTNGEHYEGEFKDGLKEGKGSFYDYKGRLVKYGKWIKDVYDDPNKKLGHNYTFEKALIRKEDSVLTFSNSKYVGLSKNGIPNLVGTYYFNNEDVYSGALRDGVFQTFGTYIYRNGSYYIGAFNNGKFNGFGLKKTIDNYYYFGHFHNGMMDGIFLGFKDRECAVYMFKDDKIVNILHREYGFNSNIKTSSPIIPIYMNKYGNDFFIGEKDSNGINGFGYLDMGEDVYIGNFINGDFDGVGVYLFDDGEFMLGQFEQGALTGLGVKYNIQDDKYIIGKFKDNKLIQIIK